MDPNYKNFMAWKKSSRGQEFLAHKDENEINSIKKLDTANKNVNPSRNLSASQQSRQELKANDANEHEHEHDIFQDFDFRILNEELFGNEGDKNFSQRENENFLSNKKNNIGVVNKPIPSTNKKEPSKNISNINNPPQNSSFKIKPIEDVQSKYQQHRSFSTNNNHKSNINFNFDTKKNKEALMSAYNSNNNSSNNLNNSQVNNSNVNNKSGFNKMYKAIQSVNQSFDSKSQYSLNNKNTKSQKTKRNIYFQLITKEQVAIESDFFLETPVMTVIKEHGGRFNREDRYWYAPYKSYIEIFKKMEKLEVLKETTLHKITNLPLEVLVNINYVNLTFKSENKKTHEINYANDRLHSIFELPSSMLTNLYMFQKAGIEFGVKKKGRMLLADEMGVGKTIQAVGISAIFKEDWPVLILCPSSLKYNWKAEILNWLKEIITPDEVQIVKKSEEDFLDNKKYYIISYDLSIRMHEKIERKGFKFAIADEAHALKSQDSKRSKLMVPILQKCKRVLLLSGTPILAKPIEIFPLLRILRPDLFHSFKPFGARYCDPKPTPFGVDWSGSSNSKELHFILSNIMIRRLKKDVLSELPPKKRQKVEIQTEKKVLNQIRVLLNKGSKPDLENEAMLSKLIEEDEHQKDEMNDQLSCFTKAYSLTGKAKIPGIKDYIGYLTDNEVKFLIFAHHLEVLKAIEEEVQHKKVKYIYIDGNVNHEKRHILVNTFQNDETCLVAILAITACATGLTLTKASTVVFAEMHFTPAIMIQAEDRAHRIGQEHNCVNVHYLFGLDTVDELIFPKLREKFFVVSSTLDDKKMDMGVEKLKSGCVGDLETKKKSEVSESDTSKVNSTNNIKNISNIKINTTSNIISSGKKKLTLTDYFQPKRKSSEDSENNTNLNCSNINQLSKVNEVDNEENICDDLNDDDILNLIMNDQEFVKSLVSSAVKENKDELFRFNGDDSLMKEAESNFIKDNLNLHEVSVKRDRLNFDDDFNEFALLESTEDGANIEGRRKVTDKK